MLAEDPTEEHKVMAKRIYQMTKEYDFDSYQMGAGEPCVELGIARKGIDPRYPEVGMMILWPGDEGYEEAEKEQECQR